MSKKLRIIVPMCEDVWGVISSFLDRASDLINVFLANRAFYFYFTTQDRPNCFALFESNFGRIKTIKNDKIKFVKRLYLDCRSDTYENNKGGLFPKFDYFKKLISDSGFGLTGPDGPLPNLRELILDFCESYTKETSRVRKFSRVLIIPPQIEVFEINIEIKASITVGHYGTRIRTSNTNRSIILKTTVGSNLKCLVLRSKNRCSAGFQLELKGSHQFESFILDNCKVGFTLGSEEADFSKVKDILLKNCKYEADNIGLSNNYIRRVYVSNYNTTKIKTRKIMDLKCSLSHLKFFNNNNKKKIKKKDNFETEYFFLRFGDRESPGISELSDFLSLNVFDNLRILTLKNIQNEDFYFEPNKRDLEFEFVNLQILEMEDWYFRGETISVTVKTPNLLVIELVNCNIYELNVRDCFQNLDVSFEFLSRIPIGSYSYLTTTLRLLNFPEGLLEKNFFLTSFPPPPSSEIHEKEDVVTIIVPFNQLKHEEVKEAKKSEFIQPFFLKKWQRVSSKKGNEYSKREKLLEDGFLDEFIFKKTTFGVKEAKEVLDKLDVDDVSEKQLIRLVEYRKSIGDLEYEDNDSSSSSEDEIFDNEDEVEKFSSKTDDEYDDEVEKFSSKTDDEYDDEIEEEEEGEEEEEDYDVYLEDET